MEEKKDMQQISLDQPELMSEAMREAAKRFIREQINRLGTENAHVAEVLGLSDLKEAILDYDYWQEYYNWNEKLLNEYQELLKKY